MGIISGLESFRGRFGDHFRVADHFGVGIISGAVQLNKAYMKELLSVIIPYSFYSVKNNNNYN